MAISWSNPCMERRRSCYGEIDLSRIHREHQAMDTVGHYNRPDIFRVTIDDIPRSQVTWLSGQRAQAGASSSRD